MSLYNIYVSKGYAAVIESLQKKTWGDNAFPTKGLKGQNPIPVKNRFSSVEEYFATIGLGAKIVQSITETEYGCVFEGTLRILRQKDNRLLAVVELPEGVRRSLRKGEAKPILPGDRGSLVIEYTTKGDGEYGFEDETITVKVRLYLEFIEPFPFAPPHTLVAKLRPRQQRKPRDDYPREVGDDRPDLETEPDIKKLPDSLSHKYSMKFLLKTLPQVQVPHTVVGQQKTMQYIMKQRGLTGLVDTNVRHSEFIYVFKALERMYEVYKNHRSSDRSESLESREAGLPYPRYSLLKFLASPSAEAKKIDIYAGLEDKSLADPSKMMLNPGQQKVIKMSRSAPAGFVPVHGGPGTGKTHLIIEAVKPFFLDKKQHKVLLTSAGNRGADNLARELNRWFQSLDSSVQGDSYIVRMHSIKTEMMIFLSEAEAAKREALKGTADQATETEVKQCAISDHYLAHACGNFEQVDDERVQHIDLAVGTMMKKKLSADSYLHNQYERYKAGNGASTQWHQEFVESILIKMKDTIKGAAAVCATVSGASDDRCKYPADLIVVDEAARVPEYSWWPLLEYSPDARGKILVGDPFQMAPVVNRDEESSPFKDQMTLSLQTRLQALGFPQGFLKIQYRAVPEVASISNKARYGGRLESDITTHVEARPLAQAIVDHNEARYGMNHSVVFFDVDGAKEQHDSKGRSKLCNEYVVAVTNIVENLFKAGFGGDKHPANIAILTPYQIEYKRLRHARTKMIGHYPQAANLIIETAGKVQGMEYDIVIVDPVVVHNIGFLDFKRLNVMFSRARCGLYVVGCKTRWNIMFPSIAEASWDRAYPLKQFAKELFQYTKSYEEAFGENCPSRNRFYSPGEFN